MGYLFSRIAYHYKYSYSETLSLPISVFWFLNRSIDRVIAEGRMQSLDYDMVASNPTKEGVEQLRNSLKSQMGTVTIIEEPFDRAALDNLMKLSKG